MSRRQSPLEMCGLLTKLGLEMCGLLANLVAKMCKDALARAWKGAEARR